MSTRVNRGAQHFALTCLLFPVACLAALPNAEHIEYQVSWNNIPAGQIQQNLTRQTDGSYLLDTKARTNSFVSMFYKLASAQTSRFKLVDQQLQVLDYQHTNQGKEPFPRHARFDWGNMTVSMQNEDGKKTQAFTTNTFDPNTLILQLRLFPATISQHFTVLDGKSSKRIQVREVPSAPVKTEMGVFEVQCLQQMDEDQRDPEKQRVATVCFSKDARRLPVELRYHTKYGDMLGRITRANP